jgi:hypothetical protein
MSGGAVPGDTTDGPTNPRAMDRKTPTVIHPDRARNFGVTVQSQADENMVAYGHYSLTRACSRDKVADCCHNSGQMVARAARCPRATRTSDC